MKVCFHHSITALLGSGQCGGVHIRMLNGLKGRCEVAIKMLNL